ncbi:hypothetical protein [Arthrobacter sp. UM1]|uniref:hypothetical protein n=1 Tax=Arthrobacter sp. UM1 TaxID=2766776 RepID=UPI001CF71D07|nr:hypothetical protein [Arthrobacter sp. UM1]MCB4208616.1 hypothetical protein [Arthrobacter sp. UM1]
MPAFFSFGRRETSAETALERDRQRKEVREQHARWARGSHGHGSAVPFNLR